MQSRPLRRLHGLLLLLCLHGAAAGELRLDAPEDIRALLTPWLDAQATSPRRLQTAASDMLATEGYFSPRFQFEETDGALRLTLDPGPRTRIDSLALTVDGPVRPETRAALEAEWRLPVGQPFRQADWNAAKQQVLAELLAEEHADARLLDSQAEIDAERQQAHLRAHYDAGPRYRFGPLRIEGLTRYDPALVARYNRSVTPDAPYRERDLADLLTALQGTPYFASVQAELLTAESETLDADTRRAPVLVRLRERQPHRLALGGGFSSNTGARVEGNVHTADLFGQAWELDTGLRLEQKRQTAYGDIFLPPDAKQRRHSLGLMGERSDIQNLQTERLAFGVQQVQQRGSIEQRLSLQWQRERREPADAEMVISRALVPNAMWTWRHVDSLLEPRQGQVLQMQVGGGSKAAGSDQNFVRLHGRVQQYFSLGTHTVLALRGELGRTYADNRLHIPQDYLFRTGGTGSVRGYAYQSLGIREGNAVVGGRYLAVGSAELTHWLDEQWGIAAFIDAGDAVDRLSDARLAVGYGLGARWRSPAGPLGVDLAYGERTGKVQLHFALSIPF